MIKGSVLLVMTAIFLLTVFISVKISKIYPKHPYAPVLGFVCGCVVMAIVYLVWMSL